MIDCCYIDHAACRDRTIRQRSSVVVPRETLQGRSEIGARGNRPACPEVPITRRREHALNLVNGVFSGEGDYRGVQLEERTGGDLEPEILVADLPLRRCVHGYCFPIHFPRTSLTHFHTRLQRFHVCGKTSSVRIFSGNYSLPFWTIRYSIRDLFPRTRYLLGILWRVRRAF